MGRFLARRAAWSVAALALFVVLAFLAVAALPFDYASRFGFGCPACVPEVRAELGLDRPLPVQFGAFLAELAGGSLGTSFGGQPVAELLLGDALWNTVLVFGLGAVLALLAGVWLGRVAAWRAGRAGSGVVLALAVSTFTLFPPFLVFVLMRWSDAPLRRWRDLVGVPADERHVWAATGWTEPDVVRLVGLTLLAAIVAALLLRRVAQDRRWHPAVRAALPAASLAAAVGSWALAGLWRPAMTVLFHAPRYAFGGPGQADPFGSAANQGGGNLALAVLAFVILAFGELVLVVDATMVGERAEHYVLTARAKGLDAAAVRDRHLGRNAVLPALSRFVVGLPFLLTGLIVLERELEMPGLSTAFFDATQQADRPVILGALLVFGALTLTARLGLEVVQALLDPRVRRAVAR